MAISALFASRLSVLSAFIAGIVSVTTPSLPEVGKVEKQPNQVSEKRSTVMKVVCAWCGKDMGEKEGQGEEGITHSMCDECREKWETERQQE